ncbi:MAG: hypothetical protein JOZ98_07905 [Solirubrobacterales bacterium]|nr:hypothetical protein [Solirubrobacterales bacterium]MBV9422817.1 hypothetical protein [Solirubrobacterales bacterium]
MDKLDRKSFFRIAGVGSVAAAGAAGFPLARHLGGPTKGLAFRATTGLPKPPLPSYATYVVEGSVDLSRGEGLITSRVLAGHPGATSTIGLPGLARLMRVTGVETQGQQVRFRGVIEDRSQLAPGESANVEVLVDRDRGIVQAPFLGSQTELQLATH